jgi:hypothetical protein
MDNGHIIQIIFLSKPGLRGLSPPEQEMIPLSFSNPTPGGVKIRGTLNEIPTENQRFGEIITSPKHEHSF